MVVWLRSMVLMCRSREWTQHVKSMAVGRRPGVGDASDDQVLAVKRLLQPIWMSRKVWT